MLSNETARVQTGLRLTPDKLSCKYIPRVNAKGFLLLWNEGADRNLMHSPPPPPLYKSMLLSALFPLQDKYNIDANY